MEYRTLGRTDLNLSVVTFGTIWFAAAPNRPNVDTEKGMGALHAALDKGVNCIHSSYEYGTRHVVRKVLEERRETRKHHHIIKVPCPDGNRQQGWSPQYVEKLVDDALTELGAERIDLVQWILRDETAFKGEASIARFNSIKDDLRATFDRLRDKGKTKWLGAFAYTNEFARMAAKSGVFSSILFYYNVWDTCLLPSFEAIREGGLGIVAFRPFQGGLLCQTRRDIAALPPGDKLSNENGLKMLRTRDQLLQRAGIQTADLTEFALRFVLSCDLVGTMITGMNTPEQVRGVLRATEGEHLPADLAAKVHAAAVELGGPWTT